MSEFVDHRALGAIEFVDAVTNARMCGVLRLEPADERVTISANRSALYVIRRAPGLEHHLTAFEHPPATPALESLGFDLSIVDPTYRYLPRLMRIKLPRKEAPTSDAQSVLKPIVVPLYPASAAAVDSAWAVLRLRVQVNDGTKRGLANVLIVVTPQLGGFSAVMAMTDARGEALVAIAGVALVMPASGGGAVLTRAFSCDVELVLDKRVVSIESAAAPALVDAQRIAKDRAAADPSIVVKPQTPISLSAGKSVHSTVEFAWP